MRGGTSIVAVAWLLMSCGGSGSSQPDATVFGEVCEPGGTFDISGRVAVLANLRVNVNASGLVELDTEAELLLAMDVDQNGTEAGVTATLCSIVMPDIPLDGQDKPIRFQVQDSTVASVGEVSGIAALSSANQTCADFESERFTIVIGAILNPIETSALPIADGDGKFPFCAPTADTECSLAIGVNCACDQEADGKPGMTLLASNVPAVDLDEVYAVLRTQFSLKGKVFSSDLILGTVDASIEQGILGCHLAGGGDCSPDQVGAVKNLNPVITAIPGMPSKFRGVRVPDGTTCAEIVMTRDDLFPR